MFKINESIQLKVEVYGCTYGRMDELKNPEQYQIFSLHKKIHLKISIHHQIELKKTCFSFVSRVD